MIRSGHGKHLYWYGEWHCCRHSLRPNDEYMRQYIIPTLIQIMHWSLFSTKPLSEPMLPWCQLYLTNIFQWYFIWNTKVFVQGDVLENAVCEMAKILFWAQWVNCACGLYFTHTFHWYWGNTRPICRWSNLKQHEYVNIRTSSKYTMINVYRNNRVLH